MRIGPYRINKISKRFWLVLLLFLVVPIIIFLSLPEESPEPFKPRPSAANLSTQFFQDPQAFIDKEKGGDYQWYPIGEEDREISVGNDWDATTVLADGTPLQNDTITTRIYVPSSQELAEIKERRPSLVYDEAGVSYYPVFAILPNEAITERDREEWVQSFIQNQELTPVIQLASEAVLPRGEYDIRGLLYARSNALRAQTAEEIAEDFTSWIPTVLLAEHVPISPAEAEKPSEKRVEINIPIRVEPYELIVQNLEWSSPDEIRLCLGASNISDRARLPVPALLGDPRFYLSINGTNYPLTLRDEARADLSEDGINTLVRGDDPDFSYFVYRDPEKPLPSLNEVETIDIFFPVFASPITISKITLTGDDLKEPGVSDRYRYRGCPV